MKFIKDVSIVTLICSIAVLICFKILLMIKYTHVSELVISGMLLNVLAFSNQVVNLFLIILAVWLTVKKPRPSYVALIAVWILPYLLQKLAVWQDIPYIVWSFAALAIIIMIISGVWLILRPTWKGYNYYLDILKTVCFTSLIMTGYAALSIYGYNSYGFILFAMSPFVFGFLNGYFLNRQTPRGGSATQLASLIGVFIIGVFVVFFSVDGLFCVILAAPLAIGLSAAGAALGEHIALNFHNKNKNGPMLSIIALLPMAGYFESTHSPMPPLREVTTSIEIAASPETVWHYTVEVPTMPAPTELSFRAGVSYPIRSTVSAWKLGATRICTFNTGDAIETITAYEPARRLKFHINSQPVIMTETSPYKHLDVPHLHGYVVSEDGEFRLTRLPNGHTLVKATSWYRNPTAPYVYWNMYTDYFGHQVHERVLEQIKRSAENHVGVTSVG